MLEETKANGSKGMAFETIEFDGMDYELSGGVDSAKFRRNKNQQIDDKESKIPSTPDNRTNKKSKMSATPPKKDEISA